MVGDLHIVDKLRCIFCRLTDRGVHSPVFNRQHIILCENLLAAVVFYSSYAAQIIGSCDGHIHILIEEETKCNGVDKLFDRTLCNFDISVRSCFIQFHGNGSFRTLNTAGTDGLKGVYRAVSFFRNNDVVSVYLPLTLIHLVPECGGAQIACRVRHGQGNIFVCPVSGSIAAGIDAAYGAFKEKSLRCTQ